jgi:thiosulfate reductase cytochrome b subunit
MHTFIPERLSQYLIPGGGLLWHVVCGFVLLDLAIVVLGVTSQSVKGSHFHSLFNGSDVNCGHGVESRLSSL